MMYCAECGTQMLRTTRGTWNYCCKGRGYWYTSKPLPSDNWYPTLTKGTYTFYPTVNWPNGLNPTPPRTQV